MERSGVTGYELHAFETDVEREADYEYMRRFFCVAHMGALLGSGSASSTATASASASLTFLLSDGSIQFDVGYSASADQQLVSMQQARQMLIAAGFSLSA